VNLKKVLELAVAGVTSVGSGAIATFSGKPIKVMCKRDFINIFMKKYNKKKRKQKSS